jgi:hypothetical protein
MHSRKPTKLLTRPQCEVLELSWQQADRDGYPLTAFITIRPAGNLSPLDHAELVAKFWNRLGVWSRRATLKAYGTRSFHAELTREAEPGGKDQFGKCEHIHALMHVPEGTINALEKAVKRWFPGPREAVVKAAVQAETWSDKGKIRSVIGYLTKQRTQQAWWNTPYSHQAGGIVLGKRYRISASLRTVPRDVALPRPQRRVARG